MALVVICKAHESYVPSGFDLSLNMSSHKISRAFKFLKCFCILTKYDINMTIPPHCTSMDARDQTLLMLELLGYIGIDPDISHTVNFLRGYMVFP